MLSGGLVSWPGLPQPRDRWRLAGSSPRVTVLLEIPGPRSVLLPRLLLFSLERLLALPRLLCAPVDTDFVGLPSKWNGRGNTINKMHPAVMV